MFQVFRCSYPFDPLLPGRGLPNGLKCPAVRNFQRIQIPFFITDEAILHLRETLAWRKKGESRTKRNSRHPFNLTYRKTRTIADSRTEVYYYLKL